MATINFNASGIDTTNRFNPLPAGEYTVIITESEMKDTKCGSGQYLQLALEVQGGQFSGRKLWDRLNLNNRNQQSVEIAQRQLAQLCHAVGVLQVQESSELHYKPVVAIVRVRQETGRDPANEIRGYKSASGAGLSQPAQQQQQAPTAGNSGAAAPWAKKAA